MANDKFTSPFLMLDYAMPQKFAPNEANLRGVGSHPHAGFETVTIALQGEMEHRDSTDNGGVIGTGDVQWMTAGRGIVHQEFHSERFSREGRMFEMLQFWVNLPAKDKNTPAAYQSIAAASIPVVELADNARRVRIIAGDYKRQKGAAHTFTELNMWKIDLNADSQTALEEPANHNLMLVALRGNVLINDDKVARPSELMTFNIESGAIRLQAGDEAAKLVLLSGVLIDEPIAAHGPFVMNSREELLEKFHAFNRGEFGDL